jgi:hypothetical protein
MFHFLFLDNIGFDYYFYFRGSGKEENNMKTQIYSITGLFLLSFLLVVTSFASEAVIPYPSYGLQPYSGTASGSTESGMVQTLKPGEWDWYNRYHGLGMEPYLGTTTGSTESGMAQTLKPGEWNWYNRYHGFGLQPYLGTTWGSTESGMEPDMRTR